LFILVHICHILGVTHLETHASHNFVDEESAFDLY